MTAQSATPAPASATPAGRSTIAPRRSDQRPNRGCTTEDEIAEARMTAPASVYERSNLSTRNGRSAGSAPFAKSVAQWPLESAVMARRSSSARTKPKYPAGCGLRRRGARGDVLREVPLDQCVRELPLATDDLDPVLLQ